MKISKIILYNEPSVPEIDITNVEKFIVNTFQIKTEVRDNIFENLNENMYENIASSRIFDLKKMFQRHTPSRKEILIESENKDMSNREEMVLYDGIELNKITEELIPSKEKNQDVLNIIFTNKLTCTFDQNDFRYHARAWVGSNPIIISTTGTIEAPAKPKQYYLDLMTNFSKEEIGEIKKKYKGQFLEYGDSRISNIIEGYALQAIFYYETGDAFCDNSQCRLFNAHWQKDLFVTQIDNKKMCKKHEEYLIKIRNEIQ
ncbi:MAG: hypothetical protein HOF28_02080 [Nitrosopumilus sp.]|nr:hypothetical protein [Nitrosopumilus sp.]